MNAGELPRLLYCSDVPPELTPGNMALYRLLQNYPPDRLMILQGNVQASRPDLRLAGPRYESLRTARFPRLLNSRFAQNYAGWLYRTAGWKAGLANHVVKEFQPQALLTIAQNYSWLIADAVSQKYRIPLHLIVWDDFVRQSGLSVRKREFAERRFADVYRRAASRLCISPNMAEMFEQRYGVKGDVLYPLRALDLPTFDAPPERIGRETNRLTFAFAGSVNYGAYAAMIGTLARVLGELGHQLHVFGGISPEVAQRSGIAGPHVTLFPLLPIREVIDRFRGEVDALFVPMTFEPGMKFDMQISFPSKLSDYTTVGLTMLMWAPDYCSAARFARENPGAAVVVNQDDPAALADAVRRIASSGEMRIKTGTAALFAGRIFDHAAVTGVLHEKLRKHSRV